MSRLLVAVNGLLHSGDATMPKMTWIEEGYFSRTFLLELIIWHAWLRIVRKNGVHFKLYNNPQSSRLHLKPRGFISGPMRFWWFFLNWKNTLGLCITAIHDIQVIAEFLSSTIVTYWWRRQCCYWNKLWSRFVYSVDGVLQGQTPCV